MDKTNKQGGDKTDKELTIQNCFRWPNFSLEQWPPNCSLLSSEKVVTMRHNAFCSMLQPLIVPPHLLRNSGKAAISAACHPARLCTSISRWKWLPSTFLNHLGRKIWGLQPGTERTVPPGEAFSWHQIRSMGQVAPTTLGWFGSFQIKYTATLKFQCKAMHSYIHKVVHILLPTSFW